MQKRKEKESPLGIEPSTSFCQEVQSTFGPPVSLHDISQIDIYLYVRIHTRDILTKKLKQHPSKGDDASTAEVAPGRVGRDEHGEARRANTTPNGGPNLGLERLRLKTLSNLSYRLLRRHGQHIYTCNYIYERFHMKGFDSSGRP